jgi:hypothetical protein
LATSGQRAAQQRAIWQQKQSATMRHWRQGEKGCVVAIDNATRNVYQISHHTNQIEMKIFSHFSLLTTPKPTTTNTILKKRLH